MDVEKEELYSEIKKYPSFWDLQDEFQEEIALSDYARILVEGKA